MSELVYILINPANPGLVKIGWTKKNIMGLIRELSDHPGVAAPFECYYRLEVEDGIGIKIEAKIHHEFKDLQVNPKNPFLKINPDIIKIIIESKWMKKAVTSDGDAPTIQNPVSTKKSGTRSGHRGKASITTFSMLNIPMGSKITLDKDPTKIAKVVSDRKIEYKGKVDYISTITQYIFSQEEGHVKLGKKWKSYRGVSHWSFGGENLAERRNRIENSSGHHKNSKLENEHPAYRKRQPEISEEKHATKRAASEVPHMSDFTRPILQWASRQLGEFNLHEAADAMARHFNLSAEARSELAGKSNRSRVLDRTSWSLTPHLKKAGLLRSTRRGHYEITNEGRKEAFSSDERMTYDYLERRFPSYRIWRQAWSAGRKDLTDGGNHFENSPGYPKISRSEYPNLQYTKPIKATINGRNVLALSWNPIMRELMELAAKDPQNLNRFDEIFNVDLVPGYASDYYHTYIAGARSSVPGLNATEAGRAIIQGATKLGFSVYIEYEWTEKAEPSKRGKISEIPIRINC